MTKRALVTGGAGFIGRWVVKALLERSYRVSVLDNLSTGSRGNLVEFSAKLDNFFIGDIRNEKLLKNIFKTKFDSCFHLAAQGNVQDSIDDPIKTFQVNTLATANIMEEAKRSKAKVVFVSSALIFDRALNKPIKEEHLVKPASPYTASKIAAENIVLSYFHTYKHPVVVLRPFSVYGPFQRADSEGGVMSIFIKRNLEGKNLEVFGDGSQTRDFFYVEECADAIVKSALSQNAYGQVINFGSGRDTSINKLAQLISGDLSKVKHIPHHHPQSEVKRLICDNAKVKKLLGWQPKISLNEGIKKTEEWFKKYQLRYR